MFENASYAMVELYAKYEFYCADIFLVIFDNTIENKTNIGTVHIVKSERSIEI